MNEKKQQLLIDLLNHRKAQVETYRSTKEYGEWSCGQQDADSNEAEYWDKIMSNALKATLDVTYRNKLTEQENDEVTILIKDVIHDFRQSAEYYFERY